MVTASLTLMVVAGVALSPGVSAGAYSTLTKVSGDGQRVALGAAYAPLQVRATDDAAGPVAGVQVTYTVFPDSSTGAGATFAGGATSTVVTSDANGLATAPTLTANNNAGFFEVDATTPDPTFQMVTFNLTNAAYSSLTKVSGDGQQVATGVAYAPLQVRASDGSANPLAGVQVTYTVITGAGGAGATFPGGATSAMATSDGSGLATAPTLTANSYPGTFEVDATTPAPTAQTVKFSLTNVSSDTTPPTATMSKPAAASVTLSTSIPLAWSGSDPGGSGVTSYDVRYRRAAWNGGFGPYIGLATATPAVSKTYSGAYGYDYCFSVKARDAAGNVSTAWSTERCTAVPLDDRSLVASAGWKRLTGAAFFHGTMTQSATLGATLTRTGVRAGRMSLVATRAPGFGSVSIYYNGKFVKKLSLAYPTTQRKHVFTLPRFTAGTGKVVIKLVTAKRVQIDGLVAARI